MACSLYNNTHIPKPKTVTFKAWVLCDRHGKMWRYLDKLVMLRHRRPQGEMRAAVGGKYEIWKPRRVKVTVKAVN